VKEKKYNSFYYRSLVFGRNFFFILSSCLFIFLFSSCSGKKPEDFREEGRSLSKSLIKELSVIRSKEELLSRSGQVEKLFNLLSETMVKARECEENTQSKLSPFEKDDQVICDELRTELLRLYRIPGIKKIIEKLQHDALGKLDQYERLRSKRKNALPH